MNNVRLNQAEHCGWMVFSGNTVTLVGREADRRIAGLRELGYGIKKVYCKPGLIPDEGYVALFGDTLRRLLEVAPADPYGLELLSRLGTNKRNEGLYIDVTEVACLPGNNTQKGQSNEPV